MINQEDERGLLDKEALTTLDPPSAARSRGLFVTTRWTMVFAAGGRSEAGPTLAAEERAALERLCRAYWTPVYAFVRRRGLLPEDAHDLTQEFFFRLIERQTLRSVDPVRGRFRNWLLGSLRNFMVGEWKRRTAQKRDERRVVWLDGEHAERSYQPLAQTAADPESQYHRDWALALVESARLRLQEECDRCGRRELFSHVQSWLVDGPDEGGYDALGEQLGATPGSLKVTVHRWRRRWAELLREELEEQLDGSDDCKIDDEFKWLLSAMSSSS